MALEDLYYKLYWYNIATHIITMFLCLNIYQKVDVTLSKNVTMAGTKMAKIYLNKSIINYIVMKSIWRIQIDFY